VAEDLCATRAVWTFVVRPPATEDDMRDIVTAFDKVLSAIPALQR